jgi:endonuclease/exonuclease/phosphatase family metal-dependent hydrolase
MKVITLNLRNFTDDHWEERLPLIGNDIKEYGAEILAFQEVRGYIDPLKGKDMAQQLQEYLLDIDSPYPYLFEQKAMDYVDQEVWEGLAILSTLPFTDRGYEKLDLGNGSDPNKRIMLWARFDPEGGPLYVSNNHFSYDRRQALRNAQQVISYLKGFKYPGLLVGDLNATPNESAVIYIKDNNWIDIWEQIWPKENGYTYESGNATKRIDYQWKNSYFTKKIQGIERVFTEKGPVTGEYREYPSDHYGVMITF